MLAATALKMPAGAAQTMLSGPDPLCNDKTAHADWSDLSNKLNDAMKGDGFIFRFRYDYQVPCDETHYNGKEKGLEKICGDEACKNGKCGVSATLLSNQAKTENPVYCIQNYPDGCNTPTVGYALLDGWTKKGGSLEGYSYFPADANCADHRDWKSNNIGLPGRGCHNSDTLPKNDGTQQFLQVDDKTWVTHDDWECKCGYDDFDPTKFGDYLVDYIKGPAKIWIPGMTGGEWPKVPAYFGQDYSVCWLEETDPLDKLFEMQNSLYYTSGKWWNGAVGSNQRPGQVPGEGYEGWNEVCFDAGIDYRKNREKLEALVVVLPTGKDNLCALDKNVAQDIETTLYKYWKDGYGPLPVVIMKNTKVNGEYQKETFVQSFTFASGNCIKDYGSKTLHYVGDGQGC